MRTHDKTASKSPVELSRALKGDKHIWIRVPNLLRQVVQDHPQPPYVAADDKELIISMLPPDGGRVAWLQVLASFLVNLNDWGLVSSFGIFQAFYASDVLVKKSSLSIAWMGTTQGALLLLVGDFSGPFFDKGHFRSILVGAGLLMVFALIMLSLSTEHYQVILTQGILVGICCGLLYIPSVALMPLYFKDRRGLALGLATSGASIGGVIYPIVFRRLLNELGFAWATRVIALIALVTLAVAAIITRPLTHMVKPARDLFELSAIRELHTWRSWCLHSSCSAASLSPFSSHRISQQRPWRPPRTPRSTCSLSSTPPNSLVG